MLSPQNAAPPGLVDLTPLRNLAVALRADGLPPHPAVVDLMLETLAEIRHAADLVAASLEAGHYPDAFTDMAALIEMLRASHGRLAARIGEEIPARLE